MKTVGDLHRLTGAPLQTIRSCLDRGLAPTSRIGGYRVIDEADVPKVLEFFRAKGYSPEDARSEPAGAA